MNQSIYLMNNVTLTLTEEQVNVLAMAVDWTLDDMEADRKATGEEHPDTIQELEGLEAILSERIRFFAHNAKRS